MSRRELKSLTDSGVQVSLERGQQERILRSGNRINKSSSELSCKQEPRRELKSSTGSAVQVSLERGRILRSGNSINKSSSELSCKQEPRRESSTGSAVQVSLERGRILRSGNSINVSELSCEQEAKLDMEAQVEELKAELVCLQEEVAAKDMQLNQVEDELLQVKAKAEVNFEEWQQKVSEVRMEAELVRLRALESLREEHSVALRREQTLVDLEREHVREQVAALTASFAVEKSELEKTVQELSSEVRKLTSKHVSFSEFVGSTGGDSSDTDTCVTTIPMAVESSTLVVGNVSPSSSGMVTGGDSVPIESGTETDPTTLVATMTRLLQAQTEAIAAQTQATAAQHLPPLETFTGEGMETEEKTFDRWIELFEERAKVAGWGPAQQLHQLKFLLDKTALKAFRTFPVDDRGDYDRAVAALRERFKLVDIEELRGLEFHHKIQGSKETIEELGLDLQALCRKAFPSSHGKEFDRLLKGRFFQAIHVKWQRKLGAPKPSETFQELFNRARVLEQHEKQYQESAASRSGDKQDKPIRPSSQQKGNGGAQQKYDSERNTFYKYVPIHERTCYNCNKVGHLSRDCKLHTVKTKKQWEAPGRGSKERSAPKSSCSAVLESVVSESDTKPVSSSGELSTKQLRELLTQRQLQDEQNMLDSGTNVVNADTIGVKEEGPKAVGPTLFLKVQIGGVPVEAMVDTGSQSTIISRSLLHKIGRCRKSKGEPLPALEKPTARLFGKDGEGGGKELTITAQIEVDIEADGECVRVPVFVQPQSGQECLLGMNVIPALGLVITRANGEALVVKQDNDHRVAHVRLVESVSIPGLKGRFVELEVGCGDSSIQIGSPVLFEPKPEILGLSSHESVVTVRDNGCIVVPIRNPLGGSVCMTKGLQIGTVRCVTEYYDVKSYGMVNRGEEVESEYDENGVEGIGAGSQVAEESMDVGVNGSRSLCKCVSAVTQTPEWYGELIKSLEIPQNRLTDNKFQQLKRLLDELSDVFALSDSELGCTDLVKHFIDTGDHQPFIQQPYDTWTGPKRKRGGQQAKKQVEAPTPESSDAPLHPRQGPITRSRV